jgi:hypothetical protein
MGMVVALALASCGQPVAGQDTHRIYRLVKTEIVPETHRGMAAIWGLGAERELPPTDKGHDRQFIVG